MWQARGFFEREKDGFLVQIPVSVERELPRMIEAKFAEEVAAFATTISNVGKSSLWIFLVLQLFKKVALNNILSQVRCLSTITHMMMMQLSYPAAVQNFYGGLFEFITFDIIPSDDIWDAIFTF